MSTGVAVVGLLSATTVTGDDGSGLINLPAAEFKYIRKYSIRYC